MEGGLPMLNCLLQHTLRSLCSCSDSSSSSKWVYAVFWKVLPRNYPPPKWDYGGTALDRAKGNKRNWILVWEDGFCDFYECERAGSGYMKGRFGPQVFFKMSHEVYNYGEGLVGKVAAENSHKWVFSPTPNENDSAFTSSWNMSIEPQPKAWEFQFSSGIQTIAVISVREGIIQLGSFDKIAEDLNLVINVQRKFIYLQSIPGVFAIQRPYLPLQHASLFKPNTQLKIESQELALSEDDKNQITGAKRSLDERFDDPSIKSVNLGWNSPQSGIPGPPFWSIPPLLPNMSSSFGAFLSKLPSDFPSYGNSDAAFFKGNWNNSISQNVKPDNNCGVLSQGEVADVQPELKSSWKLHRTKGGQPSSASKSLELKDEVGCFGPLREREGALNRN